MPPVTFESRADSAIPLKAPASQAFQAALIHLAPTDATVLIEGETGSGKEVAARYLHTHSRRCNGPFMAINCGALSESLAEAELFGYEKGAFTGALRGHAGWFEAAHGGTLLLDEIGELSPGLQVKLLRVLQEREITRLGSRRAMSIDVRVIAATHVDLRQAIHRRQFREDLFYRLNIARVHIPPLRQRVDDIPLLTAAFVQRYARLLGREVPQIPQETLTRLMAYPWPGNVRELENSLHHALLMDPSRVLMPDSLVLGQAPHRPVTGVMEEGAPDSDDLACFFRDRLGHGPVQLYDRVLKALIETAMEHEGGNQSQAAALLGISRHTLRTQLAHLGLIKGRKRLSCVEPQQE